MRLRHLVLRRYAPRAVRSLHVACLPFPSPQGTQAVLRAMLESLGAAGHDTHLLSYAHGVGAPLSHATHHRLADVPRASSLRSGPSIAKVVLDLQMVVALRRLASRLRPSLVVAHGVEAAHVARLARVPAVYFAHTRFDAELPTYASHEPPGLARVGAWLDASSCRLPTLAITPALAAHLRRHRADVEVVLPPWAPSEAPSADERAVARAQLSFAPTERVVLYAGNLDGYQGWEEAAEAVRRTRATWLVATESDTAPLSGWPHRRIALSDEADRRRAYAACDVVVVPRRAPGGLPIKLLDALARDVPVVAGPRALAGLRPDGVTATEGDDAAALASGIARALSNRPLGGRAWIARELTGARFVAALQAHARS